MWAKSDLPDAVGPVIMYDFCVIACNYTQWGRIVNKILYFCVGGAIINHVQFKE